MPADIARPSYDRAAQGIGIVHFGIGAFHRAHQAWYTDLAMDAGDRDWAISGVSLRSREVADQLGPQAGLYTLTERGGEGERTRLIGAVREVLVAGPDRACVIARLAAPQCHLVSFTVTEKGYCRRTDGSLDPDLAAHGFYPLLAEAMAQRHVAGLPGLTLLSCDNLADNGRQLERLVGEYLALARPDLSDWFAAHCTCPSTMVDRIVPATTPADRHSLAARLGLDDFGAVFTEPFSQWVIEDRFAGLRPRWDAVGGELVADVRPYEAAKLRMLNGAHSLLAYCGLARGYSFVHQAIADPALKALVEQLMLREAAPSLTAAPGQDLPRYAAQLIERFANPALNHRLIQIAMDGSQKLPQRWLETLAWHKGRGSDCPAIMSGLSAWIRHLRGANGPVDDPLADRLASLTHGLAEPEAIAALVAALA